MQQARFEYGVSFRSTWRQGEENINTHHAIWSLWMFDATDGCDASIRFISIENGASFLLKWTSENHSPALMIFSFQGRDLWGASHNLGRDFKAHWHKASARTMHARIRHDSSSFTSPTNDKRIQRFCPQRTRSLSHYGNSCEWWMRLLVCAQFAGYLA